MSGGGGSSTSTVQNSNAFIPQWLDDYTHNLANRSNWLSEQPYEAYTGNTVAGFDPAQIQAYNQVVGMQGMGGQGYNTALGAQTRLAQQANPLTAAGIQGDTNQFQQGFLQNVYNPSAGLLGGFAAQGPATAQGVASNAQQLMSPYTSAVIDPANQLMQQQLAQNLQTIGAQANQAGAFGGSRMGVQEGVAQAQAALGSEKYLGELLNNQWQNAMRTGSDISMQGARQGYDANAALASQLAAGYGGSQKLGANLADTNLSQGLASAQQLPQSLTSLQNLMLGQSNALNTMGAQQQQYQQNILNAAKSSWAEEQAWPYQQLQTLLGTLSGIPYSTSNTGYGFDYSPYYSNTAGQIIGGTAALGGLAGGVGSVLNSGNA